MNVGDIVTTVGVGAAVGASVRLYIGVGEDVGESVGEDVGESVGKDVDEGVGEDVGDSVGEDVGESGVGGMTGVGNIVGGVDPFGSGMGAAVVASGVSVFC